VYCPRPRSRRAEKIFMSPDLAKKIIDESDGYNISSIETGENGDSFLNPEIIPILRLIRQKTGATIRMFTNFENFTPAIIDTVLEEGLLDKVVTNIDGADHVTYGVVKGLDLNTVESNIHYFLEKNNRLENPIQFKIQCLTISHYVQTVQRVLGRPPLHVPRKWRNQRDDFDDIVKKWKPLGVTPQRSVVTLWDEKSTNKKSTSSLKEIIVRGKNRIFPKPCRMLDQIRKSLFILPSGQVYLCCADFNFELIIGDLQKQTVQEIVEGKKREELIKHLAKKSFEKIGGPCLRPDLCRIY
jgi:Iron-sulfur cluster-binding domain